MQGIISLPTGSVEGMEQSVQHHVMVGPDLATVIREREMHMLPMEAVDYIVQYCRYYTVPLWSDQGWFQERGLSRTVQHM